jgi:hypothetical protein
LPHAGQRRIEQQIEADHADVEDDPVLGDVFRADVAGLIRGDPGLPRLGLGHPLEPRQLHRHATKGHLWADLRMDHAASDAVPL